MNEATLQTAWQRLDATIRSQAQDSARYQATLIAILSPLKAATTSLSPLSPERILITTAIELINDSLKVRQ